ncbi:MAG: TlpA family protein disulfide reductase [Bryobacterales bacterium]|nr:TlpA family protein disulfide reductase [Bryobacterales bacterium]
MRWILFVLTMPLLAQEDARVLLREVAAKMSGADRYHIESESESQLSSEWQRSWSRGRLVMVKDGEDRVRYESRESTQAVTVVANGAEVWLASPDTREYVRKPRQGKLTEMKDLGPVAGMGLQRLKFASSSFQRLDQHLIRAERIRREKLEVDGKAVECVVVRADYTPPPGSVGIVAWMRTFWIDEARKLLLREESVNRGALFPSQPYQEVESRHVIRYLKMSVNEPVEEKLFTYSPPSNFAQVDKLERAYPRPALEMTGKPAPEITARLLDGAEIRLADFKGKIVLLNFWATWCEPCRKQMPELAQLYRETKEQGLVLLGINDDETPEIARKYVEEGTYGWPHVFDGKDHGIRGKYRVEAIPTAIVIDREGKVAEFVIGAGASSEAALKAGLRKLGLTVP